MWQAGRILGKSEAQPSLSLSFKLSRVSQGLRLRLSGVYSVSFSLAASTEAPRFWFSFFSESQYRMPWLLEDGLSPFYNARVAWHIPSPGQAVESTVEVERERVTRRDHITYAIVYRPQDGLLRAKTRHTFVRLAIGELAGDAERKTGKVACTPLRRNRGGLGFAFVTRLLLQGMEIVVIWTVREYQALKGYVIC